jgi:3-polyprenyl-4-hydroxybenzoate decarboxylase
MTINTQDSAAKNVFQIALIAQAAAYSVKKCVTDYRGVKVKGKTLIGSKQDFNVTVVGSKIADGMAIIPCKRRLLVMFLSNSFGGIEKRCAVFVFHPDIIGKETL